LQSNRAAKVSSIWLAKRAAATRPGEELTAVAEGSIHQGRIGVYDVTVTGNTGRIIAVFRASPTGSPASRSKA